MSAVKEFIDTGDGQSAIVIQYLGHPLRWAYQITANLYVRGEWSTYGITGWRDGYDTRQAAIDAARAELSSLYASGKLPLVMPDLNDVPEKEG